MGSALGLREDLSALELRALARWSGDAAQLRRLLALAVIYAGGTRRDAALSGGVGLHTVRARTPASGRRGCGTMPRAERAIVEFRIASPPHWQRSGKASHPECR